jgi:NADH-quinone oxidoreductase subunit J
VDITVELIVFLIFSGVTLGSAVLVVTSRNLFHAGLYLMVSLFGVAGLFLLLMAFFLAGVQVVIYVGAIAVLIILAVMLTPQVTQMRGIHSDQWPFAAALAVLFFILLAAVITPLMDELGANNFNADFTEDNPAAVTGDPVFDLGEKLVDPDYYMLPFEVASVLLMAAIIGAVLMVRPEDITSTTGGREIPTRAEAGDD